MERTAPTDAELHVLAATLMRMDPKAGCVWFAEAGGRTIRSYPRGKTPVSYTHLDVYKRQVNIQVGKVKGVKSVNVILTFDPVWDKSMMSEEALLELNLF